MWLVLNTQDGKFYNFSGKNLVPKKQDRECRPLLEDPGSWGSHEGNRTVVSCWSSGNLSPIRNGVRQKIWDWLKTYENTKIEPKEACCTCILQEASLYCDNIFPCKLATISNNINIIIIIKRFIKRFIISAERPHGHTATRPRRYVSFLDKPTKKCQPKNEVFWCRVMAAKSQIIGGDEIASCYIVMFVCYWKI